MDEAYDVCVCVCVCVYICMSGLLWVCIAVACEVVLSQWFLSGVLSFLFSSSPAPPPDPPLPLLPPSPLPPLALLLLPLSSSPTSPSPAPPFFPFPHNASLSSPFPACYMKMDKPDQAFADAKEVCVFVCLFVGSLVCLFTCL